MVILYYFICDENILGYFEWDLDLINIIFLVLIKIMLCFVMKRNYRLISEGLK